MNFKTVGLAIAVIAMAMIGLGQQSKAGVAISQYQVTDFNGGNGPHGLWTNRFQKPSAYYKVLDGEFTVFKNDSATTSTERFYAELQFTAQSGSGIGSTFAKVDLAYSNFHDTINVANYKVENGAEYDGWQQDFFGTVEGSISFFSDAGLSTSLGNAVQIGAMDATYKYGQFGIGANAKHKTEFGFSSWIKTNSNGVSFDGKNSSHWDLNIALTGGTQQVPGTVPEPGAFAVWAAMILGIAPLRRRGRSIA